MAYLLSLDQGTTSSRAIVFDANGLEISMAQAPITQHFPQPGWVEHDATEIWQTQLSTAQQAIAAAGIRAQAIRAIGISNQRETTVLWDRRTGEPIARAIVWQDRRTVDDCRLLSEQGLGPMIQAKTGLLLDAYFSATKLKWLLDHVPDARKRAERGELAFGTIDSWLTWNLSGARAHVIDVSNASRTLLFNIHTLDWDEELLTLFQIPPSVLPKIVPSSAIIGQTDSHLLGASIELGARAGDQQAATFGQACFDVGMAKNTYGTGCFLLMNTGHTPIKSENQLLSTVGWQLANKAQATYCLEGSVFMGGAVVQWLRDGLGIINNANEIEALACSVADTGDVFLVPAFTGLGAPFWDGHARGTIVGLTRGTTKAHIARAALEGIVLQTADVLAAMQADAHTPLTELRVDGGASQNNLLMQLQADLLGISVVRPKTTETTALGAAYLAGLACGVWKDIDDLSHHWQVDRRFEPAMRPTERADKLARWHNAIERSRNWAQ